ncbi:MAG: DUF2959 domain-containing protein [Phycisphaerae bacterium]|nr:DUF2959 domain-containing protein [Phycisphaerae bacterium]
MKPLVFVFRSVALALVVGVVGCSATEIALREKVFGSAKRDQLVDRVEDAREAQQAAKEQFASALEEFLSMTGGQGTKLEAKYKALKTQSESAAARASAVSARIRKVESVGQALFSEWESELSQYKTPALRQSSESMLRSTRQQYDRLIGAMRAAESRMQPVLDVFNEQVLFLKHNLNAQAIASLQGTAAQVESDVANLIRELEASIAEANEFIDQMGKPAA